MDPLQRLAQERFGPAAAPTAPVDPTAPEYPHAAMATPKGPDCVIYADLGEGHVAATSCPCGPNLVHCGEERVWLHQRLEDDGVKIGTDL